MTLSWVDEQAKWLALVEPSTLAEQFKLDALVYGTACAKVDATGRIERVHPLDAARLEIANAARNARKRQQRARRGK